MFFGPQMWFTAVLVIASKTYLLSGGKDNMRFTSNFKCGKYAGNFAREAHVELAHPFFKFFKKIDVLII